MNLKLDLILLLYLNEKKIYGSIVSKDSYARAAGSMPRQAKYQYVIFEVILNCYT